MPNIPIPLIGAALLGKAREAVIGLLFSAPGGELHVREIARRTGFSAPTIARELRLLEDAGVLLSTTVGRQVHYRPDPAGLLFPELQSIATKTWGIRGRVSAGLEGLRGIDCAFLFGSFAAGQPHQGSDVDLLVIGSIDFAVLSEAMTNVSADIGRTVNGKLYRPGEWARKLRDGNSFIASVAAGPKLFVVGDEGVLNAVGESRAARGAAAAEPPRPYASGNRKPSQGGTRLRRSRKTSRRS
jgi:predicted nucleotidyltransferase